MEKALTKRSAPHPTAAVFERKTRRRLSEKEEEEEEEGVEEKIEMLKKMVPGAAALGIDALFEETASYILALQCQIKTMRVLSSFLERFNVDHFSRFGG